MKEYKLNPKVEYCVDLTDIKIFIKNENNVIKLNYPEAAVFDLIIKNYSQEKIIYMIQKIALINKSHAESLLSNTVIYFERQKILINKRER